MNGMDQLIPQLLMMRIANQNKPEQPGLMNPMDQAQQPMPLGMGMQGQMPAGAMPGFDPTMFLRGMQNPFGAM